jgi:hypothetical protein
MNYATIFLKFINITPKIPFKSDFLRGDLPNNNIWNINKFENNICNRNMQIKYF